jgi:ABC-type multidrug transport system ATPase subunit
MQDDALMPTATPREALRFSARLRLASTVTEVDINARVENMLQELGIVECADVIIGGALIKGISGGQRKRTSVGVEIITDPMVSWPYRCGYFNSQLHFVINCLQLLFLDEPTSGLDSFSAFQLVKLLQTIAATQCTILCTIHQPSSEVFFLFDRVMFLKDGQVFYQGPASELMPFYANKGEMCPENYNPADFVMNLVQSDSIEVLQQRGLFALKPDHFVKEALSEKAQEFEEAQVNFVTKSSFGTQLSELLKREVVNTWRDTAAMAGRFGVTIVMNLILGLIYLNAGSRDNGDNDSFSGHVGCVAMLTIFAMMGSAQGVMLAFPFERPLLLREYVTGTCKSARHCIEFTLLVLILTLFACIIDGLMAYFVSKLLVEIPLVFCQMLVQFIIAYFFIDLQGNFIFLVLICFGLGMVSCSVAMLLGCLVPDVKDVSELSPLAFVPQILFAGFFVRTSQIPLFLRWAQYLVSLKYAINLFYLVEFDLSLHSCNTSLAAYMNCKGIVDQNDINRSDWYIYIILIFALFVGFRSMAGFVLTQKAKRFY